MTLGMTPTELAALGSGDLSLLILDVRREAAFTSGAESLPGAIWRDPDEVAEWEPELELARPILVACAHGHEVSQEVAAFLRDRGWPARYLVGGIEGWREAGGAMAPKPRPSSSWVTRARPKIDRIACPWLIRRFIDPGARFRFVPASQVLESAAATGAVPFDVPDVDLTHVGDGCSFDTFLVRYGLHDPALARLAPIVRGADTDRHDLAPQAAGLFAISLGLSACFPDDHAMLRHGLVLYDALYRWCRDLQEETHGWPPRA